MIQYIKTYYFRFDYLRITTTQVQHYRNTTTTKLTVRTIIMSYGFCQDGCWQLTAVLVWSVIAVVRVNRSIGRIIECQCKPFKFLLKHLKCNTIPIKLHTVSIITKTSESYLHWKYNVTISSMGFFRPHRPHVRFLSVWISLKHLRKSWLSYSVSPVVCLLYSGNFLLNMKLPIDSLFCSDSGSRGRNKCFRISKDSNRSGFLQHSISHPFTTGVTRQTTGC